MHSTRLPSAPRRTFGGMKRPLASLPSLETLEDRIAPAVLFQLVDLDGDNAADDLRITGSAGKENVLITEGANTTILSIDANGDGDFTDPGDKNAMDLGVSIHTFAIDLKGGNDGFTYDAPNLKGVQKSVNINLGSGNNSLRINAPNIVNDGARSDVRFDILGGSGNDFFDIEFANVVNSRLAVTGHFLGGADGQLDAAGKKIIGPSKLAFTGNKNIDDSTVHIDLDLGTGSNAFDFFFKTDPGFGGTPSVVDVNITGSDGAKDVDDISFRTDSGTPYIESMMRVNVNLQGGNDRFIAKTTGDFVAVNTGGILALDVNGGAGNDILQVTTSGQSFPVPLGGLYDVTLRGGEGNDVISFDFQGINSSTTSLRHGLRLLADGGAGNDTITASITTTSSATLDLDIALRGGSGDDFLAFFGSKNGGNPTLGPGGRVLLDGGFGNNFATTGGDFTVARFNCGNLTGTFAPGIITGDFDGNGLTDIRITGNAGKNNLVITDGAASTIVSLDLNGDGDYNDPGEVNEQDYGSNLGTIIIDLQGGDDYVNVLFNNLAGDTRSYLVSLGAGKNTFEAAGATANLTAGSDVGLEIEGGAGNDYLNIGLNSVKNSRVYISAQLGAGVDGRLDSKGKVVGDSTVGFAGNRDLQNASVYVGVDLGSGANRFTALLGSDLDRQGGTTSTFDYRVVGSVKDKDAVTLDLTESSFGSATHAHFVFDLLGGNDTFATVIPLNNTFRFGNADGSAFGAALILDVNGGMGNDTLAVTATGNTDASNVLDGLFDIALRGGDGKDKLTVDLKGSGATPGFATSSNAAALRGLQLFVDGGLGDDQISASLALQAAASYSIDVMLRGGFGRDIYNLEVANASNTAKLGKGTGILLEVVDPLFDKPNFSTSGTVLIVK